MCDMCISNLYFDSIKISELRDKKKIHFEGAKKIYSA